MSAPQLLQAAGLSKNYGGRHVLQDISLNVFAGETVGLFGSNGAGKTTCFNILAGIVPPSAGTVSFAGEDITRLPINKRADKGIGLLPQDRSVFTALNVMDNIRAVLQIRGEREPKKIDEAALRLLHDMGVEHLADAHATELSGGELRRVEIARALAVKPRLLLLDEPFAAIDPITVNELQRTLRDLCATGISLVLSDHNVRESLAICDRSYIMHTGRLLCSGTPAQVAANDEVRANYLGADFRL